MAVFRLLRGRGSWSYVLGKPGGCFRKQLAVLLGLVEVVATLGEQPLVGLRERLLLVLWLAILDLRDA
jgi:hypothetical protein